MKRSKLDNQPFGLAVQMSGALILIAFSGCATVGSRPDLVASTVAGQKLLEAAMQAHGSKSFEQLSDIAVSYDGQWQSAVWVFQPILVDRDFRKRSEERIVLPNLEIGQRHVGPKGNKQVFRASGEIDVRYNGVANLEPLKDQAAAAVADAYAMFLLGPEYFRLRNALVDVDRPATVDGRRCEQILAVLRPGFGTSPEDRVLIAIDSEDHMVRRLRFTFDALPSTQGVVADVLPSHYVRIDGVSWPTQFVEIIRNPFANLTVHRWRVTGLDTNRGLSVEDLQSGSFGEAAEVAAGTYTIENQLP